MKIVLLWIFFSSVVGELHNQLRYFETLKHVDVKVRKKRSVDRYNIETKDVSFSAFGKNFNLVLTPGSPVISTDFKAKLVFRDGQTAPLNVNENDFFTGHLLENENITADAHTEDGLWTANIYEKDDIYTLEPSWRHLPPSDNHSMIVYRHSDIKWNNIFPDLDKNPNQRKKICGALYPENEKGFDPELEKEAEQKSDSLRQKRDVTGTNTCQILAVADYQFFKGPGGGFPHRTTNYIIQTMQKVDRIYRGTTWNADLGFHGMGLQIKELRIHPEYTSSTNYHANGRHYNMDDREMSWPDEDLLKQFGDDPNVHQFCLAHLFTHRRFAGGVLGLAYIASSRKYGVGGICSHYRNNDRAYNTGFSSTMNTKGDNLLTQEAVLVTTHEFGHNWGSEHDAETAECAPNSFNNGKFIMYPYAVSGYDENNDIFSPCSKRYIASVLATRSSMCFKEQEFKDARLTANIPLCGNGIIDKGEECDSGGLGLSGLDLCCSKDCKFIGDAVCSSINYECCKDCKLAPHDTLCRLSSKEVCKKAAYCTGFSLDCPNPEPMPNNSSCIDEGKCFEGNCLDFCTYTGKISKKPLLPCRCDDHVTSCLRCCRSIDGVCRAQNGSRPLPDGRPCRSGYCENGSCQKAKANMIQRLFSFIEHLDSSTLVAFMKSNIVGTIIVFSLLVWIPASWAVSCIDKRNERKSREQEQRWVSNDALLNRSLQSTVLANHLPEYTIKDSKLTRMQQPPPTHYLNEDVKYRFAHEPDGPLETQYESSL